MLPHRCLSIHCINTGTGKNSIFFFFFFFFALAHRLALDAHKLNALRKHAEKQKLSEQRKNFQMTKLMMIVIRTIILLMVPLLPLPFLIVVAAAGLPRVASFVSLDGGRCPSGNRGCIASTSSANTIMVIQQIQQRYRSYHIKTTTTAATSSTSSANTKSENHRVPKVIIFDLDGCLWRPEMYELLYFSGGAGAPFTKSPQYASDGIILTRANEPVKLLGEVRDVMCELYHDTTNKWSNTKVGISSRTDQPDWARELLQKFTIACDSSSTVDDNNSSPENSFALKDVFQGPIEIAKDSKEYHFKRIAKRAGVQMEDILFFDNERGNCHQIADLGVAVAYCPDGITSEIWDVALQAFPTASGRVIGLDMYDYDSDWRRTQF